MFVTKEPAINNDIANYNVAQNPTTTIKTYLDLDQLSQAQFDFLINKIFQKFTNPLDAKQLQNRWYLRSKWLSNEILKILSNKTSQGYTRTYNLLKAFYNKNPFELEQKTTLVLYNFFKQYENFAEHIDTPERGTFTNQQGLGRAVAKFFVPLFITFITDNLVNNSAYEDIQSVVVQTLRQKVDQFVKAKEASYQLQSNSQLLTWITTQFNYKEAKKLQVNNTIDQFFKNQTNDKIINVSKADFVLALTNEFQSNLTASETTRLKQVVFYYLLNDLLITEKIQPVEKGTLSEGKQFLLVAADPNPNDPNSQLPQKLEIFLKRLNQTISKFDLYWKTSESPHGLSLSQPYIKPTDKTNSNYELGFRFRFFTAWQPLFQREIHQFVIPLEKRISAIEQAKNVVTKFIETVQWNSGYMNQPQWTEKDLVQWGFDNNFQAYKKLVLPTATNAFPVAKKLSAQQWNGFSSTRLSTMDLSTIKSKEYAFVAYPFLKITNNKETLAADSYNESPPPSFLGTHQIVFRILQYPKGYDATDNPIQVIEIAAKQPSQTLSIVELFHKKVLQRFPSFLNFNSWTEQERFFWVNEFLDENGELVANLNQVSDLTKRSNLEILFAYAAELTRRFNQDYRPSFEIVRSFQQKKSAESILKSLYEMLISFRDSEFQKRKLLYKSISLGEMRVFGEIKTGPLKDTKGLDIIYREKLQNATPLPTYVQEKPEIESEIPDNFTFKANNKLIQVGDIIQDLKDLGFTNVQKSKVKWELEDGADEYSNFVSISYDVEYHNFLTGESATREQTFNLYLNFDGVNPEEIQIGYDNVIKSIPEKKKKEQDLLKQIDKIFKPLKDTAGIDWRKDVSKEEYQGVIERATDLIAVYRPGEKTIKQIEAIYGNNVPSKIISKFADAGYIEVFNKILNYKDNFSQKSIKQILENDDLLKFFREQETGRIEDLILKTLEYSEKTKYAYLGTSIGLGLLGILAGATSLKRARIGIRAKAQMVKYKKTKYISFLSVGAAIVALCGSAALMLLFFIEKGGI